MDYMVQEQERGITITSAATNCFEAGHGPHGRHPPHQHHRHARPRRLHDRGRALAPRARRRGRGVLDGGNGVEPADRDGLAPGRQVRVPRIVFVNKMDKRRGLQMNVNSIKRAPRRHVPSDPVAGRRGDQHKGVVDLITMKAAIFDDSTKGQKFSGKRSPRTSQGQRSADLPREDDRGVRRRRRRRSWKFLGRQGRHHRGRDRSRIRKGCTSFKFFPVLCGSAFKNKGVQLLLDAVVNHLRRRSDIPPVRAREPAQRQGRAQGRTTREPFAAYAFKIINDPHGNLTFFRVYSGTHPVRHDGHQRDARKARAHRPHPPHARQQARGAHRGRLGQHLRGGRPRDTRTGDTLCDEEPIVLEKMIFPGPSSRSPSSRRRRRTSRSSASRSSWRPRTRRSRVHTDEETGQTIIAAWASSTSTSSSTASPRVQRRANVGKPGSRTARRSRNPCEAKWVKRSGGRGQYGHVSSTIEPSERGTGFVFENDDRRRRHPEGVHPGDREGRPEAMGAASSPATPRRHEGAAPRRQLPRRRLERGGGRDRRRRWLPGRRERHLHLLEPVMKNEGRRPRAVHGDVIGDLNSRRGKILGMSQRGNAQVIAEVRSRQRCSVTRPTSVEDAGPRDVVDAVFALRTRPRRRRRRRSWHE